MILDSPAAKEFVAGFPTTLCSILTAVLDLWRAAAITSEMEAKWTFFSSRGLQVFR